VSYGLSVFKADGSLGFSTADVTWQTLDQFTVNANASVSNSYSEASGMTIIAQRQMVNVPPNSQEDYVPNVTINGTTVSVAPQSGLSSSQCIIHVLAQDA
jgi:hypothetical protein|tara:strand:+ start:86 stop:385 length:300 start_codon:yes stop_codon:yes gene_type:complete